MEFLKTHFTGRNQPTPEGDSDNPNRKSQTLGRGSIKAGLPGLVGGRGGGMSTRDKAKIKDIEDTQKRVLQTQLRIDEKLQNIRIDEFRSRMTESEKQIHDIKDKMESIKLIAEFQEIIKSNQSLCEGFDTKLRAQKDLLDDKIEAISDRARELKRDIETLHKG